MVPYPYSRLIFESERESIFSDTCSTTVCHTSPTSHHRYTYVSIAGNASDTSDVEDNVRIIQIYGRGSSNNPYSKAVHTHLLVCK